MTWYAAHILNLLLSLAGRIRAGGLRLTADRTWRVVGCPGTKASRKWFVRSPLFIGSAVFWILFANGASASMVADDGQGPVPPGTPTTAQTKPGAGTSDQAQQQREAAAQGDARAQFALGWIYAAGEGVPKDYVQAVLWWRKAAEQGLVDAQLDLAVMYQNGVGVPKDDVQAVEWYRKAAERGDARAQLNLGEAYQDGVGVSEDAAQAVKWWHQAAEQGNVRAQNYLGEAYHNGQGIARDYLQAAQWYLKAAEQEDAQAQSNLGFMYQNGQGVPKDAGQAVRWWLRAAELGHVSAQYNLAVAYHNGDGVVEDFVEAHKWVVIATAHASDESQKRYSVLGDALRSNMTLAQVAEAQKRAREWLESFERRKQ